MMKRSIAHMVGWGAVLVIGTAGAAQALPGTNTVDSGDIIDGEVRSQDIRANAISSTKVASNSLFGADIATNTLTGADINESTLNLANQCRTGLVHSFARVKGSPAMPNVFTANANFVDTDHTCSGGAVLVRRVGVGEYRVRFNGDPAVLGQATLHGGDGDIDNIVALRRVGASEFQLTMRDQSGVPDDGWATVNTI